MQSFNRNVIFDTTGTNRMARPPLLTQKYSGLAGERPDALINPLALISQTLYMPRADEPTLNLPKWEFPVRDHPFARDFASLLRTRKAFVLGGTQFLVELGALPAWYRDDDIRKVAHRLIKDRNLATLLNSLGDGRENSTSLFGKGEISEFFDTLPKIRRKEAKSPRQFTRVELRKRHPLRLRKIIEFIVLTEAVLRWRFANDNSLRRFSDFTQIRAQHPDDALYVWDHFWIEPVFYILYPAPREADIRPILETERIAQKFAVTTGEDPVALYWLLHGVPDKLRNVKAAADACNSYYGNGVIPTQAVTVRPDEFRSRLNRLDGPHPTRDHGTKAGYILELGPNRLI
jgi:hypothetical protein